MTQIDPKSLIARLTCKVCWGKRQVPWATGRAHRMGTPLSSCPRCGDLNDEKDIMGLVNNICAFDAGMDPENTLAETFVNLAEFCALRGIEPKEDPFMTLRRQGKSIARVKVRKVISITTLYPVGVVARMDWAWLMFRYIQSLADGANLDLAGAVSEVMKEREE